MNFARTGLGHGETEVCRLGLSASYRPGKRAIFKALDAGINVFFLYGFDTQMVAVLRDVLQHNRENYVVVTGAYNLVWWHPDLRRTVEKRLRQLGTDYIDAFLYLGVLNKAQFGEGIQEDLCRLRDEGRVRGIGLSTHDRRLAGELAAQERVDLLMMRYNAAHRGAEQDIFPHLTAHRPTVISYTATRWRFLLHRPRSWPKDGRVPTPAMCYRFVLSNPNVDVCLSAPTGISQLEENLEVIHEGPLCDEDMQFMCTFGDVVHGSAGWFM
jgi:aryl-alcohol dehydrogenase-like predicted oxidoreductase